MDLSEHDGSNVQTPHPWELARLEIIKSQISKYLPKESPHLILDFGCGNCFIMSHLAKFFPNKTFIGVDSALDDSSVEKLNPLMNDLPNCYAVNSLDKLDPEQGIDAVLALDVMEHIENDMAWLTKMRTSQHLTDNAFIFLTVPAYQSLFCSHDTLLKHYRRYNATQLKSLFLEADFNILDRGHFFCSLVLPRCLEVLIGKSLRRYKEKTGLSKWTHGHLLSNFIAFILLNDYRLCMFFASLGFTLPGLTAFIIAKKSEHPASATKIPPT